MKKTKFFKWADGDVRWTPFLVILLIATIVCVATMGRHLAFALTSDFSSRGIWTVLGLIVFYIGAFVVDKVYSATQDTGPLKNWMFALACLYFGAILGPVVGLKLDRQAGIPDESVYYANGKVRNYTNPNKKDFYFKTYKVSTKDSLYILEYGEEPGYNWNWRSVVQNGLAPKSTAPRADEDTWVKPLPVETQKIKDP